MYICWFIKFFVVFLPGKYYQQKKQNFNKTAACPPLSPLVRIINKKPTVPSGTNTVIGALVYLAISSDLRSKLEQSHHHHGALLPW